MYHDCINISGSLSKEDEDENIKKAMVFENKHQLCTCVTLAVD